MLARLLVTASAIIILLYCHPSWAAVVNPEEMPGLKESELPAALADDDSFADLPFEQLRQALRDEVELGPQKGSSPYSSKKYNLLIR